jgi:hypothetical protein
MGDINSLQEHANMITMSPDYSSVILVSSEEIMNMNAQLRGMDDS